MPGLHSRPTRRAVVTAALAIGALALPATPAAAASLIIVSPPNGARIPTTSAETQVTLAWAAETSGCYGDQFTAQPVVTGPISVQTQPITAAPPSGGNMITFRTQTPNRVFSWYVGMDCPGVGEIRSETRTFTIAGPDPRPRLAGRLAVNWGGSRQVWTFRPNCATGACATRVKIPGVPWFRLRYDWTNGRYSARVSGKKAGRAALCREQNGNHTWRGAYRGWLKLDLRVTETGVVGAQTFARTLAGRLQGRFTPTAHGSKLGCPAFRESDPVTAEKR
jgi:hypothetical protein